MGTSSDWWELSACGALTKRYVLADWHLMRHNQTAAVAVLVSPEANPLASENREMICLIDEITWSACGLTHNAWLRLSTIRERSDKPIPATFD